MSSTTPAPLEATEVATPVGPLAIVTDAGTVVASGFTTVEDQLGRLDPALQARGVVRTDDLGEVTDAVHAYFAGDVDALDRVRVRQPGGDFTQEAWRVMRTIPAGQTWSYAELATKSGRPAAVRAAGSACARNMVAPFVPCHRVVRTGGSLGGYYYGLPVKQWLLDHERGVTTAF
ncbi:MAG: methylated-DNA--[protein]-cysteine S-methyltransferase [Actinomycetes bacterium]